MSAPSKVAYEAVDLVAEKDEEFETLLESALIKGNGSDDVHAHCSCSNTKQRSPFLQPALTITPWLLSIFFGALALLLWSDHRHEASPRLGTYEAGFATDLVPPSKIPLQKVRFRGSPNFSNKGTAFLDPVDKTAPWPENMVLFGPPSPEIDANWDRILDGRYFSISEDEAERAWGDKRFEYVDEMYGGYTAGLEVFHALHCVNALRQKLHPEYYHFDEPHGPFHTEHCLDAIRQTIQCYGSTTLIPLRYRDALHHSYVDSGQEHTCRSFSFLREFLTSRAKGQDGFAERDQSVLNETRHKLAVEWKTERKKGTSGGGHHGGGMEA
ncbi:hypothetical protein B0H63DRAFT_537823 [Podospora didyma]|uniref:Uncharacterized protein n=1 Tax=Podospora didyma TaxID=330526 RepID=A0AAE0U3L2_9PEZI|nr:hypothetical protein B0H63DRAFT_537823 [Podospora didyma]